MSVVPAGMLFPSSSALGVAHMAAQASADMQYQAYTNSLISANLLNSAYSGADLQQSSRAAAERQWAMMTNAAPAPSHLDLTKPLPGQPETRRVFSITPTQPPKRASSAAKPVRTGAVSRMGFGGAV